MLPLHLKTTSVQFTCAFRLLLVVLRIAVLGQTNWTSPSGKASMDLFLSMVPYLACPAYAGRLAHLAYLRVRDRRPSQVDSLVGVPIWRVSFYIPAFDYYFSIPNVNVY
ncbi:hypothetical protein GGR53DRAFT_164159 [Hypoxylon sp. FL1150]|nr:hypothetical protein GGR53DRAFT_164159 [Hypoxylon sp. FL1150]